MTEEVCRLVVCDDDILFLDVLTRKIWQWFCEKQCECQIKQYSDSVGMLQKLDEKDDIYFLDIDMPQMSGLELAEQILCKNAAATIIFVSNHEELVFKAIHYAPFRFIRKAKVEEEVSEALQSWFAVRKRKTDVITVTTQEGLVGLALCEICYLESKGHYLLIHTKESIHKTRGKISEYEERLRERGFVRVQIGYLVNCSYIKALRSGVVTLASGEEISIGRARREAVKHAYMTHVREKMYGNH